MNAIVYTAECPGCRQDARWVTRLVQPHRREAVPVIDVQCRVCPPVQDRTEPYLPKLLGR